MSLQEWCWLQKKNSADSVKILGASTEHEVVLKEENDVYGHDNNHNNHGHVNNHRHPTTLCLKRCLEQIVQKIMNMVMMIQYQ